MLYALAHATARGEGEGKGKGRINEEPRSGTIYIWLTDLISERG